MWDRNSAIYPISCDYSCSGCYWNNSDCISYANGYIKAPDGTYVDPCPDNTTKEKDDNDNYYCKPCLEECIKWIKEDDTWANEDNLIPKCLRCGNDSGFYLFKD